MFHAESQTAKPQSWRLQIFQFRTPIEQCPQFYPLLSTILAIAPKSSFRQES
ncbi:hypothetical protein [Dolichospermum flos-aquae]|uniref:Uncharacterized protein n=1 Tax=Dolichospermum flos-aquae LEGE 04289 TaxID=1828708 RepID=A0ACC5Q1N6_DOLFA|nr:hypothetical protein [Dolichospermum flos-aquae]MBE9219378.1 hypothetical protein [Dolichospermum flos-aquae LEGE 04289]